MTTGSWLMYGESSILLVKKYRSKNDQISVTILGEKHEFSWKFEQWKDLGDFERTQ